MTDLLTTVALVFILAGPFLLVANRFDLPTVPFLILAGLVVGAIPTVEAEVMIELARYGIALLVFTFGIKIDIRGAQPVLGDSEAAAIGQVVIVGATGVLLGIAVGVPLAETVYLGIAVALSSTIVGTALLQTETRRDLVRGRLGASIQFIQDLLAILVLLVLGAGTLAADPIATQIGYGVSLLVAAVLVNRYLFDAVGRFAGGSDELMIVGVLSLLVLFLTAAEVTGISIVVGGFAAGIAVRYDPFEYLGLLNGIESITDFFVAIFFVTLGALVQFPFVGEVGVAASVEKLLLVVGIVLLTAVLKPAITTAILVYKGYEARSATLTSLSIDQVSEFALIIAIEAFILGLLSQLVFDAIILAAAITMITSSLTQRYDESIYRRLSDLGLVNGNHRKIDELSKVPDDISDHVVIVGYGTRGQRIARACEAHDRPYVAIENDPAVLQSLRGDAGAFVFGDAMEEYTWEKANVEEARLVVSTVESTVVSERLLSFEFDAGVIVQTNDPETAVEYFDRGASYVTVPDLLAGEHLTRQLQFVFDDQLPLETLRDERLAELESYVEMIEAREPDRVEGVF